VSWESVAATISILLLTPDEPDKDVD